MAFYSVLKIILIKTLQSGIGASNFKEGKDLTNIKVNLWPPPHKKLAF
tara:strand:- start:1069 stop:1212 length:144 start_codon:yes stop_codon:yes gene_type:complete